MSADSEIAEDWREIKSISKIKRASNREFGAQQLVSLGILFQQKNQGAHLIVYPMGRVIDFWPGTGLWVVRGQSNRRRGLKNLIAYCQKAKNYATV